MILIFYDHRPEQPCFLTGPELKVRISFRNYASVRPNPIS